MTPASAAIPITAQRRIARRLLPLLFMVYVIAFVDRVNIGYAGLDMTRELHFSNEVFGFGTGIFFVGYCLLEIPGALLAQGWSARKWIAAIMIVWGTLASLTGLIHTATQFNIIRFFVGLAEGGMFPAMIVYLTHWFRHEDRAKSMSLFMVAVPFATAFGGMISGRLLSLHWFGLAGWRWVLILEGAPAVIIGIVAYFFMTDWPQDARWLNTEEREWIIAELKRENLNKQNEHAHVSILTALRQPVVLLLACSYFCSNLTVYGIIFWLPKMVQKFGGLTNLQVSLVASIPYFCTIPTMLLVSWHSDKTGERRWHTALAMFATAIGLIISQLPGLGPYVAMAGFSMAVMGVLTYLPCFWTIPTRVLSPAVAAAAVGFITLGNLGGLAGPYAIGFLTDLTGTYVAGMLLLIASATTSGLILLRLRVR